MKKQDIFFFAGVILFFLPFFIFEDIYNYYVNFNAVHGVVMSYIKFFILGTLGEVIGLRIKEGIYNRKGFGILPRAIVWGFLGISVFFAFKIFAVGVPVLIEYMGLENAVACMKEGFSDIRFITALSISILINTFYAPVLMAFHKITDTHITKTGGTVAGLFTPIQFGEIMVNMDWSVQWNFVLKRTIPIFWIPAQTINFLLPEQYRILMAAFLGVVLGVLLAIASLKSKN